MLSALGVEQPAPAADDGDAALLARIGGGDQLALRELYEHCSGRALAVSLRILRDRRDAEEVLQEAFLEVWRHAGGYDVARGRAGAWLVSIVRNRAIDRLRTRGSAARLRTSLEQVPEGEQSAPQVPHEALEQQQERARVRTALDTLPPEQRAALELAYFEGCTQVEIAARSGEALGTVKTRVRLGLQKLTLLLDDRGDP